MLATNANGWFPYTPATNLIYGLSEACDMLLEEGLDAVFARHARHAEATRIAVTGWGLEILCSRSQGLLGVALTAIVMPEGHDADAFRKVALENFNMSLGQGLTKVAGKVFRIGHLGDFNDLMLMGALSGVEMALGLAKVPHKAGGVQAALTYLRDTAPGARHGLSGAPLCDAGLAVGAAGPGDDPRTGDRGPLRVRADPMAAQLGHADRRHAGRLHGGDAGHAHPGAGHRRGDADQLPRDLRLPQRRVRRLPPAGARRRSALAGARDHRARQRRARSADHAARRDCCARTRSARTTSSPRCATGRSAALPRWRSTCRDSAAPSIWRRSRPPSPAATTTGAMAPTGAARPRSSRPGTTRSLNGPRSRRPILLKHRSARTGSGRSSWRGRAAGRWRR